VATKNLKIPILSIIFLAFGGTIAYQQLKPKLPMSTTTAGIVQPEKELRDRLVMFQCIQRSETKHVCWLRAKDDHRPPIRIETELQFAAYKGDGKMGNFKVFRYDKGPEFISKLQEVGIEIRLPNGNPTRVEVFCPYVGCNLK